MLGAPLRLFNLLNGPSSLFHHRPSTHLCVAHSHSLTSPFSTHSAVAHLPARPKYPFLIKTSQQFHSQSTLQENNHVTADAYPVSSSHPWPEWSNLLESISITDDIEVTRNFKEEFVPNESLSMEFLDAACSCLRFAHDRPEILGCLSKDDIQVLINDGTPFLFKSSLETERRMRSFLQGEESNEATTVDLMKYILSYASNPIIHPERNIKEATESSARNLLSEMANISCNEEALSSPIMGKYNEAGKDVQTPNNLGPIMKRGEWQCPKCSFFNHGRNMACLKCECSRPGEVTLKTSPNFKGEDAKIDVPNGTNSGYPPFVPLPPDMFAKNSTTEPKKPSSQIKDRVEEEKSERWSSKVAELHNVTDLTSAISDDDFPEIMPMRKGENRFVVSKKKDRSLTSPKYKQDHTDKGSSVNFVPFVPFPPDYFSQKNDTQAAILTDETPSNDTKLACEPQNLENARVQKQESEGAIPMDESETPEPQNQGNERGRNGKSLEGSAVKETDPLDMSEEAKAERWFRRVAQIKDISELSQIPDEDFPEIMPMRKGVNRFVVSKRKTPLERRLTNTEYRKDIPKKVEDSR